MGPARGGGLASPPPILRPNRSLVGDARGRLCSRMPVDLTGGVDRSSDHFLAATPDDPHFRESASVWISDDAGLIGLPRIGIEAVAESWDKRDLQVNLGFPDGRSIVVREPGVGRS